MTREVLRRIHDLLDEVSDGITEYANTLESTDVITDPLNVIYNIIEEELTKREVMITYDGDELCCNCGMEFPFTVEPNKSVEITCPYCGARQHPCSLCDTNIVDCCGDCKQNILKSLALYEAEFN